MDEIVKQVLSTLLTYGPSGLIAVVAIGLWWGERQDRKEAQEKLEKALTDWNTDSKAQSDKLAVLVEKTALMVRGR